MSDKRDTFGEAFCNGFEDRHSASPRYRQTLAGCGAEGRVTLPPPVTADVLLSMRSSLHTLKHQAKAACQIDVEVSLDLAIGALTTAARAAAFREAEGRFYGECQSADASRRGE